MFYVYDYFACMCVCICLVCLVPTEAKEDIRSLELEPEMLVSCHADAGN